MVAEPADENKLALLTCAAVVLQTRMMNPAAASMTIMIIDGICTCPAAFTAKPGANPSLSENSGSKKGNEPSKTTNNTAMPKIATDETVPGLSTVAVSLASSSILFAKAGSFIFSKNSGSSFKSFPRLSTKRIPTITPIIVDGIHIIKMSASFIPSGARTVSNAAVAAETGLAVIAMCAAVTLILKARSGRILFLMATSAIIGMMEYEMWAVPANKVKK